MTAATISPTPSGIAAMDDRWGGLRPGAAALLVGRASAGRTALAMSAVRAAVDAGQMCLLLSPRDTDALAKAAGATGVDLAALHKTGRLRVLRIPSAKDLSAKGNAGLDAAYRDLASLAVRANADRVVIEDFTPLVQYTTFEAFGNAFNGLRSTLSESGAAFLLGLGEPANDASQRLLSVVQDRVNATVRVSEGPAGQTVTMEENTPSQPAPAQEPPATPAPEPPVALAPQPPAPQAAPRPEPLAPSAPAPVAAPEPIPLPEADTLESPEADTFEVAPERPFLPDPAPAFPSSDGASVALDEPLEPGSPAPPMGLGEPLATPTPFDMGNGAASAPLIRENLAPTEPEPPSSVLNAGIEIAPPPDPDLLAPTSDPFGRDPGGDFFDNGYLVDSRGAKTVPVTAIHQNGYPEVFTPPETQAPEAAAPRPSFSSLSSPDTSAFAPPVKDDGKAATRAALDAAFDARDQGVPFLVIAARMEASQPESVSFKLVIDGLKTALPAGATLYADASRLRSLLVLPGADSSGAQQIFAALQKHLQIHLGGDAESTLQAVAAITVPDGQPFGSSEELWKYAVES